MNRVDTPWRWRALLVVFVVAALVASVVIPTSATGRIISVYQEMNERIEPARLAAIRLDAGLAAEQAQRAARVSDDPPIANRYHATTLENDHNLLILEQHSVQLGEDAHAAAVEVVRDFQRWRALGTESAADSVSSAITHLELRLALENRKRLLEIRRDQRINFISNAELVIAALAAIAAVVFLTLRERRMMGQFRIRAAREASLREAAEAFAASYSEQSISDVAAKTAVRVAAVGDAFVVLVRNQPDILHEPCMLRAVESNQPCILQAYDTAVLNRDEGAKNCKSAMALPMRNSEELVGILLLLAEEEGAFHPDDLIWARTFQHIAGLAFEKSRLLRVQSEARIKLESLVESRSRLMRGFSHDVKNPLGAADGFAALLVSGVYGTLSSQQEDGINRIRRSIQNALTLIDDLHDFVRAEAGHVTLRRSSTDIAGLVQAIGLQYEAAATAKNLSFRMRVADELPPTNTDSARLRQIIGNLLSNAIKYTDAGSIELRASVCDTVDRGDGVLIEVADTGPGVPSEKQDYIFEEFSRLPGSHPGAGLGLSISKLLTEALGGQISVRSTLGEGSTFSLWIPVAVSDGGRLDTGCM